MRKMARSTARKIGSAGLLVILASALSVAPAVAKRRHAPAPKASAGIGYAAPGTGVILPNGQDNLNAVPRIVSCNPRTQVA